MEDNYEVADPEESEENQVVQEVGDYRGEGVKEFSISTPSFKSILSALGPIGVSTTPGTSSAVIKAIEGDNLYKRASADPSKYGISSKVTFLGQPMKNQQVSFYDKASNQIIATVLTDDNGIALLNTESDKPTQQSILSFLGPAYFSGVENLPTSELTPLTVWQITWTMTDLTDPWLRLQGRSIGETLPYKFWDPSNGAFEKYVFGLAGYMKVTELIPIVGSQEITYDIGVSVSAGYGTWQVAVEADKGQGNQKIGSQELTSRSTHARLKITASNITMSTSTVSD